MAETKKPSSFFESSNTVLMQSAEQKERILDGLTAKQKKALDERVKAEQKLKLILLELRKQQQQNKLLMLNSSTLKLCMTKKHLSVRIKS